MSSISNRTAVAVLVATTGGANAMVGLPVGTIRSVMAVTVPMVIRRGTTMLECLDATTLGGGGVETLQVPTLGDRALEVHQVATAMGGVAAAVLRATTPGARAVGEIHASGTLSGTAGETLQATTPGDTAVEVLPMTAVAVLMLLTMTAVVLLPLAAKLCGR